MTDDWTEHRRAAERRWMARALELARQARGRVAPNPAVGAVLVHDGEIVGEGFTMPPGGPHAEVVALLQAGERARGATLFVTLEPCAHHGRTPPCVGALLDAGIARVVIAVRDPFPAVDGRSIQLLTEHGIPVELGLGAEEAIHVNAGFFKRVRSSFPEITAKFAMSLDGRIATRTGHSRWVTGPDARQEAHRLRDTHDAILVGVGTVLADDPLLTTRLPDSAAGANGPHHPLRVVVDTLARTPPGAAMLRPETPGQTIIVTTDRAPAPVVAALRETGAEVVTLPEVDEKIDLRTLMEWLGHRGINSVLVEGGGRVLGSLFDAGLVDRVVAFVAPVIIGGEGALAPVGGVGIPTMETASRLVDVDVRRVGADLMISGRVAGGTNLEDLACSAESSRRSAPSSHSTQVGVTTP